MHGYDIAKGLRLLNRIAHADAPVGITAMAKEMGLEKSNVHRTLTTLMTLGYVQKDGATGRYGPTLKVWELGMKVVTRHPMVRAARPFMQMLHQQTQETIHLTILDGGGNLTEQERRACRGWCMFHLGIRCRAVGRWLAPASWYARGLWSHPGLAVSAVFWSEAGKSLLPSALRNWLRHQARHPSAALTGSPRS